MSPLIEFIISLTTALAITTWSPDYIDGNSTAIIDYSSCKIKHVALKPIDAYEIEGIRAMNSNEFKLNGAWVCVCRLYTA